MHQAHAYTANDFVITIKSNNAGTSSATQVTTASYSITDGGSLDEDKSANSTIIDPSGPAVLQNQLLQNTGQNMLTPMLVGSLVASVAALSSRRRSKKIVAIGGYNDDKPKASR